MDCFKLTLLGTRTYASHGFQDGSLHVNLQSLQVRIFLFLILQNKLLFLFDTRCYLTDDEETPGRHFEPIRFCLMIIDHERAMLSKQSKLQL